MNPVEPKDVWHLVAQKHAELGGLIVAATLFVVFVLAVQIVVKVVIFRGVIRSNNKLADECRLLLQMVATHGQITDSQKVRTDRTLSKVQETVLAAVADHDKIDDVHKTVKRIDEKIPDTPSGVGLPAFDPANPPKRRHDDPRPESGA